MTFKGATYPKFSYLTKVDYEQSALANFSIYIGRPADTPPPIEEDRNRDSKH